jgi:hypothetical protein
MLKSHSNMKPVQNWHRRDAGINKNAPKASKAIGKGRQRRAIGLANGIKAAADQ